jgi:gamma-glutamylcyclotransferase (GGCT)/AIG2-like uncharacterized protein YtfP
MIRKLFVYGTLRKDFKHKIYDVLRKNSAFLGYGELKARMFDIGEYPGVVKSKEAEMILGEVYAFHDDCDFESLISKLDHYEGAGDDLHNEYIRRGAIVRMKSGVSVKAWVYWYTHDTKQKNIIREGDYIKYLKRKSELEPRRRNS